MATTETKTIKIRQGLIAALAIITPAQGEPCWTTDGKKLYIGDGATMGGIQIGATVEVAAPATSASTGVAGTIAFDNDYIYRCIATNTWRRASMSDW